MLFGVHGSWKFRPLVDKNLRPNWTTKITLEAFEKVDEASADREQNVDDTLLKKPRLQTGSIEEIENCSMHSEDISNNDRRPRRVKS